MPSGRALVIITGLITGSFTLIVKVLLSLPAVLAASIVKEYEPDFAGLPEILPLSLSSVRLSGKFPPIFFHVIG